MATRCFLRCQLLVLSVVLVSGLLAGCSRAQPRTGRDRVIVLSAASTADAVEEIARLFQGNTGIEVEISTGPSNGLAQQIMAGAPVDVFLSANRTWADAITEEGLAGETVDLLANRMVLIVPKGNPARITQPSDLDSARVSHVAIAGENVPAGVYAEQALRNLKLFDRLQQSGRLARGSDVRITLVYVERAEAEAGIVYATDARISDSVEVVTQLDPRTYDPVVYPAVLLKASAKKNAAQKFFDFLQSPEGQAVFRKYGFAPLVCQP